MLFIRCAYLGFNYKGFQVQPNVPTVQGVIQTALRKVGYSGSVRYVSRTDAGVSAVDQIIFLRHSNSDLVMLAQRELPADIKLYSFYVGKESKLKLRGKEYLYIAPLFPDVDLERLEKAVYYMSGRTHNYYYLIKRPSETVDNPWMKFFVDFDIVDRWIYFRVAGKRFYWEQVRRMVNLLLSVGMHRIGFKTYMRILRGEPYKSGIPPAPPEGLILFKVQTSFDDKFVYLENREIVERWVVDRVKFKVEEAKWVFIASE